MPRLNCLPGWAAPYGRIRDSLESISGNNPRWSLHYHELLAQSQSLGATKVPNSPWTLKSSAAFMAILPWTKFEDSCEDSSDALWQRLRLRDSCDSNLGFGDYGVGFAVIQISKSTKRTEWIPIKWKSDHFHDYFVFHDFVSFRRHSTMDWICSSSSVSLVWRFSNTEFPQTNFQISSKDQNCKDQNLRSLHCLFDPVIWFWGLFENCRLGFFPRSNSSFIKIGLVHSCHKSVFQKKNHPVGLWFPSCS